MKILNHFKNQHIEKLAISKHSYMWALNKKGFLEAMKNINDTRDDSII